VSNSPLETPDNHSPLIANGSQPVANQHDAISEMINNVRAATRRRRRAYDFPWLRAGYMMQFQQVERAVLREVSRHFCGLEGLKILDIGCGAGGWLREFIKWGAEPGSMTGIDAMEERLAEARHLTSPEVRLIRGNAAHLDLPDQSFDLVMMFECLCMMTDQATRKRMASEALRVLKDNGVLLFYDFRYRRPGLDDVFRPLAMNEIRKLFPGCNLRIRSIHPFPPLSRKFAALTPAAWHLLNFVPPLRTSYFGSIRKPLGGTHAVELDYARLRAAQ